MAASVEAGAWLEGLYRLEGMPRWPVDSSSDSMPIEIEGMIEGTSAKLCTQSGSAVRIS